MRAVARTLALLAAFGASLLAGRVVVARVVPWQPETTTAAKLHLLEDAGDDIELVFVGSSRVFRQVDPAIVDAGLSKRGLEVDSLNLGVPGVAGPELLVLVDEVLETADSSLQWIVVDIRYVEPILGSANLTTTRVTWWHDLSATVQALSDAARANQPAERRLEWARNHLAAFANHATGTGVILDRIAGPGIDPALDAGADNNGFVPLERALEVAESRPDPKSQELADSLRARSAELADAGPEEFERRVSRLARLISDPPPPSDLQVDYLARLAEVTQSHGVGLVLLVPPGVSPASVELGGAWLAGLGSKEDPPVVLNFNDPATYPELFEYRLWFDQNHLGSEGARLFSALLAEALADVVTDP